MVFTNGAKLTADIVEEIAGSLIATPGGYWTDITVEDPGATMWNTTVKTQDNAKRAIKYDNGIESPIYIAMEIINRDSGINFYYDAVWRYGKGIRVVISPSWNSTTHTYPATGIQSTFIPFEGRGRTNTGVVGDLALLSITYYLWVESNGFVVIGKPEPQSTDAEQQSFIIALERSTTKEYADGYTNFFLYTVMNQYAELYDGNNPVSIDRNRSVLRPFAFQWPDITTGEVNAFPNGYGVSFPLLPTYIGYKSVGNGKVYYVKPIVHNTPDQLSPIFQSELFFIWTEGTGLIDGDVVAVQGQTTKYLCKSIDSPDNASRLVYAIKYMG